jgi:hypothetical protein
MLASAPRLVHVVSPDRPLDRRLLHARGGFAWWYLDALDARGDGLVVIWSFGLPFLPGYRAASRRGEAPAAGERPSLNVAVYRGGREVFYLLQEYPPEAASWSRDGASWRFGDSVLRSDADGARRRVELALDCPVPGGRERLRGRIELEGVARRPVPSAPVTLDDHDWSPLTGPAQVVADLRAGDREVLRFDGRGYHDRNGSRRPLDRLGIRSWIWGRVPARDRELVYYLCWPRGGAAESEGEPPEVIALEIDADGATHEVPVTVRLRGARRARWGMPWWERIELRHGDRPWLEVRHRTLLDDGPFYLRFATAARPAGEGWHTGSGEMVRPGRVDLPHWRPLVRMRVHHTGAPSSRFAPLFSGHRATRLVRQAAALAPELPGPLRTLTNGGGARASDGDPQADAVEPVDREEWARG